MSRNIFWYFLLLPMAFYLIARVFLGPWGGCALAISPATCITTYSFTGTAFDQFFDDPLIPGQFTDPAAITGSFTVAEPLPESMLAFSLTPLDFSFSDSRFTYTPANSLDLQVFKASTDAAGNITQWQIELRDIDPLSTSLTPLVATHFMTTRTLVFLTAFSHHYVCTPADTNTALCGVGIDSKPRDSAMLPSRQGLVVGKWTRSTAPFPFPEIFMLLLLATGLAAVGMRRRISKHG